MTTWVIIVCVIIFIGILIIAGFTIFNVKDNIETSSSQRYYSFSQAVDPTTGSVDVPLIDGTGASQITCPTNSKVNIVTAFYQVNDPYGQCSGSQQSIPDSLKVTCAYDGENNYPNPTNVSTTWKCSTDADCAGGTIYQCSSTGSSQGTCILRSFAPSSSSADDATTCSTTAAKGAINGVYVPYYLGGGYAGPQNSSDEFVCIEKNVCLGLTYFGGQTTPPSTVDGNYVCAPGGTGSCAVRDASAYVAAICDGQQTCNVKISDFGPTPCNLSPPTGGCLPPSSSTNIFSQQGGPDFTEERLASQYCQLPFAYGSSGGLPIPPAGQLSTANPNSSSFNLGYYVHGFYTCIPDVE